MKVVDEPIPGLKVLKTLKYIDERGYFSELFKSSIFKNLKMPDKFVQINESQSIGCVRRGLHLQWNPPMAKIMRVTRGSARLVALDLRVDSENFGKSYFIDLNENDDIWLYGEYGFARGFETSNGITNIEYLVTSEYNSDGEGGISSFDFSLKSNWLNSSPIISEKDLKLPSIEQWTKSPVSKLIRIEKFN